MFTFWATAKGKPDEARLLREARAGDMASLGVLFEMHRAAVRSALLRSRYGHIDPDLIDDAIQESFVRLSKTITTTDIRSSFKNYLIAATIRRLIDLFRKNHTSETKSTDEDSVSDIADLDSSDYAKNTDARIDLGRAMSRLSTYEQLILKLYYVNDLPLRTIGPQVGKSLFQVSRDLDKARKKLKSYLEE